MQSRMGLRLRQGNLKLVFWLPVFSPFDILEISLSRAQSSDWLNANIGSSMAHEKWLGYAFMSAKIIKREEHKTRWDQGNFSWSVKKLSILYSKYIFVDTSFTYILLIITDLITTEIIS